jgi:hypothetical protein
VKSLRIVALMAGKRIHGAGGDSGQEKNGGHGKQRHEHMLETASAIHSNL